jgi:TolB-like protein
MSYHRSAILSVVCAAAFLGGCVEVGPDPARAVDPRIGCHKPSPGELRRVRRVVFIHLAREGEGTTLEVTDVMTKALHEALLDKKLFAIEVVDRTSELYRDLKLDRPRRYTIDDIQAIRKTLDCDAVLIGKVRDFQQMPRMKLGLYLSLVDVNEGRVVWGVDHHWDTTDRAVQRRIKTFFERKMRTGYGPTHYELGLSSPRTFAKFIAAETAATLTPPPPKPDIPPSK